MTLYNIIMDMKQCGREGCQKKFKPKIHNQLYCTDFCYNQERMRRYWTKKIGNSKDTSYHDSQCRKEQCSCSLSKSK